MQINVKKGIEEVEILWRGQSVKLKLSDLMAPPKVERNFIQEIPILGAGGVWCDSITCPLTKGCTNHVTAGDFRNEFGDQPDLYLHDGKVFCDQVSNSEGSYIVFRNGNLIDSELS